MRRRVFVYLLLFCWPLAFFSLLAGCAATQQAGAEMFDRKIRDAIHAYGQGKTGAANRLIADAVREAGGGSEAYVQVAQRLSAGGRPGEAVTFLDAALQKKELSWDPMLWATLADAAKAVGDTDRANKAAAQAAIKAEDILASVGSGKDNSPDVVLRLMKAGLYYDEHDEAPKAIQALREALRRAPGNRDVLNNLGYILADKGTSSEEFKEALERTEAALRLDPDDPIVLDSYGWALFKNGDAKKARRVLRKAVEGAPNQPEIRYHLGVVYQYLGMTSEAKIELERAIRLRPNYAEAEEAKKQLLKPPGKGVLHGA